ncbi:gluconate 2-dehydrogenase subunit 3 family protein [Roseospira marina]|uniref:Gluconate 2-dehydrogenase subunit 3 family protein n=1 Tax=Roseospira marina TaxID=140057 RepID=A0A5M6IAB0_9PROT|nr:gluconate 2-dehydrogenase subunit 3 family protein [Roseospira marina]KAA5605204.1 gluconate 2-dehydrogenase subunit 3 family protein [Roseospira marina]MBB4314658.1 hypothetical protein [Roseospira marina]MBB5087647.1 hypothetical protein [Roseospira marina]
MRKEASLTTLIDAILPGDAGLGLPAGSRVGVPAFLESHGLAADAAVLLSQVETVARDRFGIGFAALEAPDRVTCVERAKRADMHRASGVLVACLRAYYTDPGVLRALSAGAVPPFPDGNALDDDDWTLLEPVYERGPIHRPVPS